MSGLIFGRMPPSIFPRPEKPPRPEPQTGKGKPRPRIAVPPDCTTAQALRIVARPPRIWPSFALLLGKFMVLKIRFYLLCWWHGYSVREVRRLARLYRLTGGLPQ